MKIYKDLEKLLEKEIRETTESGELNPTSLDLMYKVLDEIKDILTICAMKKDDEYQERMMYDDYSRGRGRYARRDSMGRYASRNYYDGDYGERGSYEYGYSRDDELDRMMQEAKTEKERDLIRQLKEAKRA